MKIKFLISKVIISSRLVHYFLKGFFSGLATLLLIIIITAFDGKAGKPAPLYDNIILYAMFLYWILITIGYIYGYSKQRKQQSNVASKEKQDKLFCPKCRKENDEDAKYCVFCGEKIKV